MSTQTIPAGPYAIARYGNVGYEIQGDGRSLAIVNKVAEKRRQFVANLRPTRDHETYARQDAHELAEIEATADQAMALANLFAAAPELLAICQEIADDPRCDLVTSERRCQLYHAIAAARGETLAVS